MAALALMPKEALARGKTVATAGWGRGVSPILPHGSWSVDLDAHPDSSCLVFKFSYWDLIKGSARVTLIPGLGFWFFSF